MLGTSQNCVVSVTTALHPAVTVPRVATQLRYKGTITLTKIYWLLRRKSELSTSNKLLTYKAKLNTQYAVVRGDKKGMQSQMRQ
jgi:hypothetical protein